MGKYIIPPVSEEIYKKKQEANAIVKNYEETCKKRMDAILEKQVDVKDLLTLFDKKEIKLLCHNTQDYRVLHRICQIAEMEKSLGETCILNSVQSMSDVLDFYQKCIFLIRRLEFDWEEDDDLLELMRQKKLSYIALAELACENIIGQKVKAGCRIADYLHRNDYKREAVLFIMRLEQKLPYSEKKVMYFAMALLDMGEYRLACEVLMKHQNPNADIKELQKTLSTML